MIDALAERVVLDGHRAVAVEARVGGMLRWFACAGEIIVSGGAIESPLLLERSGIGDAARLNSDGIEPLVQSPAVGEHMIEHLCFSMKYRLARGTGVERSFFGLGLLAAMARWFVNRRGIIATGPFEVGAFMNVAHPDGRTDAQLYLGVIPSRWGTNNPVPLDQIDRRPGVTIYAAMLRPSSEGSLHASGPKASDLPEICPHWLSTADDRACAVALVKAMRRFVAAPPLGELIGAEELPGKSVETDADILEAFRRLSTSGLHAVGTCRMGSGNRSVVDPRLRVRGVDGLRVADCSVIPLPVTGNTNAPAMAVGLRAAAMILADRG